MNRRIAALAISAVALLGLTACTGTVAGNDSAKDSDTSTSAPSEAAQGDSDQTVADACAAVGTIVQDATTELQDVAEGDPAAAAAAMQNVADSIGEAADSVTNAEVAAILPDLKAGFAAAAEVMTAVAGGDLSKATELQTSLEDIQTSFATFSDLCTAG